MNAQMVLFVGIQGSGKSSFFKERFFATHIRINLDMLRTRHREAMLVQACLEAKQSFVIDNTNPTRTDRERYVRLARGHDFAIACYYFQSKLEDCLRRNAARPGKARVPDVALRTAFGRLQLPERDEGFAEIFYVRMQEPAGFIVEEWKG